MDYKVKEQARCIDGVSRTAFIRSYWDGQCHCVYADTYFSTPAFVRVGKLQVRGFVTHEDGVWVFTANKGGKNASAIKAA